MSKNWLSKTDSAKNWLGNNAPRQQITDSTKTDSAKIHLTQQKADSAKTCLVIKNTDSAKTGETFSIRFRSESWLSVTRSLSNCTCAAVNKLSAWRCVMIQSGNVLYTYTKRFACFCWVSVFDDKARFSRVSLCWLSNNVPCQDTKQFIARCRWKHSKQDH